MKKIIPFIPVFIGGMITMVVIMMNVMPRVMPNFMINEHKSKLSYKETISKITEALKKQKWQIVTIHDVTKSVKESGHTDMTKMTVILTDKQGFLYNMMKKDSFKKFTAMMPAGVGVYEKKGKSVYISLRNVKLMGRMFGQGVGKTTRIVSEEWKEVIKDIIVKK